MVWYYGRSVYFRMFSFQVIGEVGFNVGFENKIPFELLLLLCCRKVGFSHSDRRMENSILPCNGLTELLLSPLKLINLSFVKVTDYLHFF
jgi:hypothetical protein